MRRALASKLPRREEHNQLRFIYKAKKVVVLLGLSRLQTGAVMAHELIHCWLTANLSPCSTLMVELEEGLCELAAIFGCLVSYKSKESKTEMRRSTKKLLPFAVHGT